MKIDIIIPTYGRSSEVVQQTLDSIYKCSDVSLINKIFVVDQNSPTLTLNVHNNLELLIQTTPSVTNARNIATKKSEADIIIYFDDDVLVQEGTFSAYLKSFNESDVAFIAGREIVSSEFANQMEKKFVNKMKKIIRNNLLKLLNNPVANITKNGIFVCDFSKDLGVVNNIETVRGCNFAIRKIFFIENGGFDTAYKGTSLREESDFIMRIIRSGGRGIFNSKACVIHLRQLGGCNNLSLSMKSLQSKLENEHLFQSKYFPKTSNLFFFFRMLPLALEHLKETRGQSLMIVFRYAFRF